MEALFLLKERLDELLHSEGSITSEISLDYSNYIVLLNDICKHIHDVEEAAAIIFEKKIVSYL